MIFLYMRAHWHNWSFPKTKKEMLLVQLTVKEGWFSHINKSKFIHMNSVHFLNIYCMVDLIFKHIFFTWIDQLLWKYFLGEYNSPVYKIPHVDVWNSLIQHSLWYWKDSFLSLRYIIESAGYYGLRSQRHNIHQI